MKKFNYPAFFIIGVQRSGTTLLRLILNNHSRISVPEEATFLMPFLNKAVNNRINDNNNERQSYVNYLTSNAQYAKWGDDIDPIRDFIENHAETPSDLIKYLYEHFSDAREKEICGDKTPSFFRKLKYLKMINPGARILWVVRDGRDVYLSLKKQNHRIAKNASIAALDWTFKNWVIERNIKRYFEDQHLTIGYEQILNDPEFNIKRITKFLGISYEEGMLDYWKSSQENINAGHSELIFKPINGENIGKWKSELNIVDIQKFDYVAGSILKKHEYSFKRHICRLDLLLKVLFEIGISISARVIKIIQTWWIMRQSKEKGLKVDQEYYS